MFVAPWQKVRQSPHSQAMPYNQISFSVHSLTRVPQPPLHQSRVQQPPQQPNLTPPQPHSNLQQTVQPCTQRYSR